MKPYYIRSTAPGRGTETRLPAADDLAQLNVIFTRARTFINDFGAGAKLIERLPGINITYFAIYE